MSNSEGSVRGFCCRFRALTRRPVTVMSDWSNESPKIEDARFMVVMSSFFLSSPR
jgi:hypothetical protein